MRRLRAIPVFLAGALAAAALSVAVAAPRLPVFAGSKYCYDSACAQNTQWNDGTAASIPGAQAWQAPTLLNSWVNYGAPYANVGYYRDAAGIVHLRGSAKTGTIGQAIFNLPAGYRPAYQLLLPANSNRLYANLDITATGDVLASSGSNAQFELDGVSFKAEQ